MVKIGEQVGVQSARERAYGKIGQQVGAKKTRAEIVREAQARRSQLTPQQQAQLQQQKQMEVERVETVSDLQKELNQISKQRSDLNKSYIEASKGGDIGTAEGITVKDKGLSQKQKAIKELLTKLKTGYISKSDVRSYISSRAEYGRARAESKIRIKKKQDIVAKDIGTAEAAKIFKTGTVTSVQMESLSPKTLSVLGVKQAKVEPAKQIESDFYTKDYETKDPSRWTTKDLASQSYFEQGLSPVAVSEKVHATMPKGLQETTSIIQPSYVTTTPFGSYIDISKPGGFAALAQQSGVKQESYFEERVVGTKKMPDGFKVTQSELFYVDPITKIDRIATEEEKTEIRSRPEVLKASTEEIDYKALERQEKVKEFFGDWSWTKKEFAGTAKVEPALIKATGFLTKPFGEKVSEFSMGVTEAIIPTTKGEVAFDIGTFAVGGFLGKGAKVVSPWLKTAPKAVKYGVTTAKFGIGGAYAYGVGSQLITAKTPTEYGGVIGKTGKELALFGGGYKFGAEQPLISPKIKLIEEPSTKQFFIQETTAESKNIFTRVTQTTPAKYKEGRIFKKEFYGGQGQIFIEKPTGVTKISDPYLLETKKVSKAPKEKLSEEGIRTFLGTADFTPTRKFTYVKPTSGKSKVVGKDVFSTSGVYSFEFGKAQPKKYTLDLNKMFKTQRFDIVFGKQTRLKQIVPERQMFLGEAQTRTLSWKTGKPIGKVGKEKIIVREFITPKEGKGITSFKGRGTPSSPAYFQKLYSPQPQVVLPKSRVPSPRTKPTARTEVITPTVAITPSVSKYYGKGMYERTDGGLMIGQLETTQIAPMYKSPIKERVMIKERMDIKIDTGIKSDVKINLKHLTKTKADAKIKSKIQIKSKIKMPLKTKQKLITPFKPMTTRKPTKRKPFPPRRSPKKTPFGFPTPSITLPRTKRTKRTSKKKAIKRQASLVALGESIFATEKSIGERSGLVIRPIIINEKKTKKKGKKSGKK